MAPCRTASCRRVRSPCRSPGCARLRARMILSQNPRRYRSHATDDAYMTCTDTSPVAGDVLRSAAGVRCAVAHPASATRLMTATGESLVRLGIPCALDVHGSGSVFEGAEVVRGQ